MTYTLLAYATSIYQAKNWFATPKALRNKKMKPLLQPTGSIITAAITIFITTNSMEESPSWENNNFCRLVKKFRGFLEAKGSLPCL
jgi:hypothetical protein